MKAMEILLNRIVPALFGAFVGVILLAANDLTLNWFGWLVVIAGAIIGFFHDKWL
jgi:hypothetical protein